MAQLSGDIAEPQNPSTAGGLLGSVANIGLGALSGWVDKQFGNPKENQNVNQQQQQPGGPFLGMTQGTLLMVAGLVVGVIVLIFVAKKL